MTDETKEPKNTNAKERLEGFAQVVIGEIESLGGVITGDPMTSAEGDFNVQVGKLHQEAAQGLSENESDENDSTTATPANDNANPPRESGE